MQADQASVDGAKLQLSYTRVVAPIAGLALGDPAGGLSVAAPLELLWLGAVNMGAALPIHEALGAAAIAAFSVSVRSIPKEAEWAEHAAAFA